MGAGLSRGGMQDAHLPLSPLGLLPRWVFFRSICQGLELLPDRIW